MAPSAPQADVEEMEFEDEEEPPRRRRSLLIVGALVGAICVGGGLAYTYRAMSGGGKTPVIAADKSAVKTKATASTARTGDQAPKLPDVAPKAAVASDTDTGPRRVATIPVGPDGSTPAMPPPSPPPMAQPPTMTMPGLTVQMPPAMPQPPQAMPRPQPVQPPAAQAPAPLQPKVITPPPQKQAALPEAAPPATPKEPRKVTKKESDAFSPGGAVAASQGSAPAPEKKPAGFGAGGSNGFVAAILSTPKGKMEAMRTFADLQTKYPDVLGGKPAEVVEVNVEGKGVWYRAVVGPPGSRSAAAQVCEQLKAAGYNGCFAANY
jgi:SPOR domain